MNRIKRILFAYREIIRKKVLKRSFTQKHILALQQGMVSFTFDDVPMSGLMNGVAILKKYNCKGTFYVSLGFLDNPSDYVSYTEDQLKTCVEAGNELACHTYNHVNLRDTSSQALRLDLDKNATKLKTLFPKHQFTNFSYPFGEQSLGGRCLSESVLQRLGASFPA